ncbi:unnamed protein product [Eruca vesicaria subsp. sativa]|uniref:Uncharacterized protein n=1 Tax=Eruca vesicaria subsp. sativa TaxID=29727 RepID=A0ABC8KSZ8_ERUVS|nr:unnamed protein product [Eruca vesicaria subsp. sativa]
MRSYYKGDRDIILVAIEGTFIAYLYALFLVLDTIVNFIFYQSCVKNDEDQKIGREDNTKICIRGAKCFQEIV